VIFTLQVDLGSYTQKVGMSYLNPVVEI